MLWLLLAAAAVIYLAVLVFTARSAGATTTPAGTTVTTTGLHCYTWCVQGRTERTTISRPDGGRLVITVQLRHRRPFESRTALPLPPWRPWHVVAIHWAVLA